MVGSYMRAIIAGATEDHLDPLLGFVVSAYGAIVDRRTVDDIATFAQPPHIRDGQKKLDRSWCRERRRFSMKVLSE